MGDYHAPTRCRLDIEVLFKPEAISSMTEKQTPNDLAQADSTTSIVPTLGLWDAVSIIVGIVVGTAIFKSPTMVFLNVSGPWAAMGVWLLGGVLSLIGALCYAELTTTYPRSGGDFHYLTKAFGRLFGFLFGWAQLSVILTGSIASMAYAFADYAGKLWDLEAIVTRVNAMTGVAIDASTVMLTLAIGSIVLLSAMNVLGLIVGKVVQNLLSIVKVAGLVGIIIAGLFFASADTLETPVKAMPNASLGLAMVFVLYAFGGWNDAAFVAAEVRGRKRNLPMALLLGVGLITAIYLLVIFAYLTVLGFEGARQTFTPANAVMERVVGPWGGKAISLLVMISALGAINGLILTGSRVYASLGSEHRVFRWLGHWDQRRGAPVVSLLVQGAIAVLLVMAVGTVMGRGSVDGTLRLIGLSALPWEDYFGGFETLVAGTAPVFWGFFLMTGLAFFVLREHDGDRPRPFRAPLFPITPIIFCCMCSYMLYSSLAYARGLAILGLLPLAIGVFLYLISDWPRKKSEHSG